MRCSACPPGTVARKAIILLRRVPSGEMVWFCRRCAPYFLDHGWTKVD